MKRKFNQWGFEKKMKMFFLGSIVFVSFLVLLLMTSVSIFSTFQDVKESAENTISFLCANYEASLEQYKSTCYAILMDDSVQKYLQCDDVKNAEYLQLEENAKGSLQQIYNANDNINFVVLLNFGMNSYIYRGSAIVYTRFENAWEQNCF